MPYTVQNLIYRGTFVFGTLPAFLGLNALLRPEAALRTMDMPVPLEGEARDSIFSIIRFYGIRNLAISYSIILIWWTGNKKLLGVNMFGGLAISLLDGFVIKSLRGYGQWSHWAFSPVVAGLIVGLLA